MKTETHLMIWLKLLEEARSQHDIKFAIEGLENALNALELEEREKMELKLNIKDKRGYLQ